jgi:hypothetical protein
MKNCKHCNQEFTPSTNKGHEQLYCTKTCSRAASIKRQQERLKQQHETKNISTANMEKSMAGHQEQQSQFSESLHRIHGTENRGGTYGGAYPDNYSQSTLERYYEAKIECNLYRIKCENLEEKVRKLEAEVISLNNELDMLDSTDEDSGGMLGSIMEQFKKDPINSIKFATAIFDNMAKTPAK